MRLKKDPKLYQQATKNILAQIDAMNLTPEKREQAIHFVQLLRESFTKHEVKKAFFGSDLNKQHLNEKQLDEVYDSDGFCRVSSITFMIAMDWHDWKLMAVDKEKAQWYYSHHWLKHVPSGKILDLTYDQFLSPVPYKAGEAVDPGAFLKDDTNVFANSIGLDLKTMLVQTKGK